MQMHLPHIHIPHLFTHQPPARDHIPTTEELARLFHAANDELSQLDMMQAAAVADYHRRRGGLILRMADLIEANERFYGTDLRRYQR